MPTAKRKSMAIKEPNKVGAATRKAERMLMDNKKAQDKKKGTARKPMATKTDRRSPTGSRTRKPDSGGRRGGQESKATRTEKLKSHLKKIIPSRLQGRK